MTKAARKGLGGNARMRFENEVTRRPGLRRKRDEIDVSLARREMVVAATRIVEMKADGFVQFAPRPSADLTDIGMQIGRAHV